MKNLELVPHWQTGWKWFSTWAFALIVFFASVPMPPEIMALIPAEYQKHVVSLVALCGLILRFVKQSHPNIEPISLTLSDGDIKGGENG
ncbi:MULTISPECIES: hypothetical protein [unclassified Moraxella]|uniref:DUF7940 domain-containing protein n=1 Tax=unclassified Moraxella TaxID=2685852 RepID=UPI003AF99751